MSVKKEFGDFQTPQSLAAEVVTLVDEIFGAPDFVIEPTAGLGSFLKSSFGKWRSTANYEGYEVNREYVDAAQDELSGSGIEVFHRDFFAEDWMTNLSRHSGKRLLVIGNPPWVTNSDLGQIRSKNLPKKTNFQGLRGFDARTGKSNFDIAEWMLIRLIESLPPEGAIAMLCKTMTARKVLRHFWKTDGGREGSSLFHIDAKAEFNVAVDACLFFATGKKTSDRVATVYPRLKLETPETRFGFIDGELVSNIDSYRACKMFDGGSQEYVWRSGVKHDAAKVMELSSDGDVLRNGLGDIVDIEPDYRFPLLKSSDLGNGRVAIRKQVIVTQTHTGEETSLIKERAPRTWDYLLKYSEMLDGRKSSIYQKRPRFSVFGIGPYSFSPWKVAVSGLYKSMRFVKLGPVEGRPVMIDDTCYSIPCYSEREASLVLRILSSTEAQEFFASLVFPDSKRPVTVDVLRRLSFSELARHLGCIDEMQRVIRDSPARGSSGSQLNLLMEREPTYRVRKQKRA